MKYTQKIILSFLTIPLTLGLILLSKNATIQAQNINPSGKFIMNIQSGKCIDVAGAPGRANGAKLELWDCELSGLNPDNNSPSDQRWIFQNGFIRNTLSGKCIDVAGAPGKENGSLLQLWDCELSGRNRDNGTPTDQIWRLE